MSVSRYVHTTVRMSVHPQNVFPISMAAGK